MEFFKTQKLTPLVLSARDQNGLVTAPVITVSEFKFENFFAVALSRNMEPSLRKAMIRFMSELRNNAEFKQKLNERGFAMPVFNANYTAVVQQDYVILEKNRQQLGIEKN